MVEVGGIEVEGGGVAEQVGEAWLEFVFVDVEEDDGVVLCELSLGLSGEVFTGEKWEGINHGSGVVVSLGGVVVDIVTKYE